MKTSYFTHTLSAALLLTTLMSCGGSKHTTGQAAPMNPEQAKQADREVLDNAIENSILSRELLGAKATERNSFEIEFKKNHDGHSVYIYGSHFEIDKNFSEKIHALSEQGIVQLSIHIDSLNIRSSLKIPSGEIELVGEKITFFEDAFIDVSGAQGEDAGEIYYDYSEIEEVGVPAVRFYLNGGDGIPSSGGMNGTDGSSVTVLRDNIVFSTRVKHVCPSDIDNYESDCTKYNYQNGINKCPTSGTDAIAPTRPGRGGRRGAFVSANNFSAQLVTSITAKAGADAPKSAAFKGGLGGTPINARFETHFHSFRGGSLWKEHFTYENCPLAKNGISIDEMSADNSPREPLPWGKIEKRESIVMLKRLDFFLREQMEAFTANDLSMFRSVKTKFNRNYTHLNSGIAKSVILKQAIYQRDKVQSALEIYAGHLGKFPNEFELSSINKNVVSYLSVGAIHLAAEESRYFSRLGVFEQDDMNLLNYVLTPELKELVVRIDIISKKSEQLYLELENNSGDEAEAIFLANWKSLTLADNQIDVLVKSLTKGGNFENCEYCWTLLKALRDVLEKNHLLYLMAYEDKKVVNSFKKRILRDNLMISMQEFAQSQIEAGQDLPEDFILDVDRSLIRYQEIFYVDATLSSIEYLAAQLLAPIYRYAK